MNDATAPRGNGMTARISYSFGAFGHDMFYGMLSTYFMNFVTGHLFSSGANTAKMVGYISGLIMILRIVELVIDPYIGNAIDKTNTRWGHFKPWVVGGGIISAVAIAILFTNMGGLTTRSPYLYLAIFAVIYIVMDIFYSFNDVAFWSMIPAISFDSEEREKTATFARIGSTIGGNLVGVIIMPVVLFFSIKSNGGTGDDRGWFMFALIVAGISAITAIGVGLFTHEKQNELRENKESTTIGQVLGVLVHNDQLMSIAVTYLFYTTGVTLLNSLELYYFQYIIGNSAAYSYLPLLNGVIGIFTVALYPALSKRFTRRNVFFGSVAIMLCAVVLFAFAGKSVVMATIAGVLFALPQPLNFLVVLMIITDSVEYGQLKLGHRDEGLVLSVRPLLDKFGGAVASGVVGLTATAAGMISGATADTITSHGSLVFKTMMFAVPAVMVIISVFIFAKKVKLSEQYHAEIVDELERTWHQNLAEDDTEAIATRDGDEDAAYGSNSTTQFLAPVDGKLLPLASVSDEAFASGSMGEGFAIDPSAGDVYAPFDGKVVATFPTNHAVALVSDDSIPVLIHVGVNTVEMQGEGFVSFVHNGQRVHADDKLLEFSSSAIKNAGKDDTVMVVFTKNEKSPDFDLTTIKDSGAVLHNEAVLEVTTK